MGAVLRTIGALSLLFLNAAYGLATDAQNDPSLPEGLVLAARGSSPARATAKSQTEILRVPGWTQDAVLLLYNGGKEGSHPRVSSGEVWLNGTLVAGPSELNQRVSSIRKQVRTFPENTLEFRIRSIPGAVLDYELFIKLPEDSHSLSEGEFLGLARHQSDSGDTVALLAEHGYRFQSAFTRDEEATGAVLTAGFADERGHSAVYIGNPDWFIGISPAALFHDGDETVILQRHIGVRISPDGWAPLDAGQVNDFLSAQTAVATGALASPVESAPLQEPSATQELSYPDANCNPFGAPHPTCEGAIVARLLCLGTTVGTVPLCAACVLAVDACSVFSPLPSAWAACSILALNSSPCKLCWSALRAGDKCIQELSGPISCDTGCQCVARAECTVVSCMVQDVQSTSDSCKLSSACGSERTGPGPDDFFTGERTGHCDGEQGLCIENPLRPCPVPVCQTCSDTAGGCAADLTRDGYFCAQDGQNGICVSGVCDSGGVELTILYPPNGGTVLGGEAVTPVVVLEGPIGPLSAPVDVDFYADGSFLGTRTVSTLPSGAETISSPGAYTAPNMVGGSATFRVTVHSHGGSLLVDEKTSLVNVTFNGVKAFGEGTWVVAFQQKLLRETHDYGRFPGGDFVTMIDRDWQGEGQFSGPPPHSQFEPVNFPAEQFRDFGTHAGTQGFSGEEPPRCVCAGAFNVTLAGANVILQTAGGPTTPKWSLSVIHERGNSPSVPCDRFDQICGFVYVAGLSNRGDYEYVAGIPGCIVFTDGSEVVEEVEGCAGLKGHCTIRSHLTFTSQKLPTVACTLSETFDNTTSGTCGKCFTESVEIEVTFTRID